MGDFSNLEDRMGANVRELHNYLWTPGWKGDEEALRGALRTDAEQLDAFLAAEGDLARNAEALTEDWGRNRSGEMLFELLNHAYRLTAATELLKRGEFVAAAAQANEAAESVSIGVCANAGCFPLVEQWEGGEITFQTYTHELTKALAAKRLTPSEDLRRQLNAVQGLGKQWDASASPELQEMGARAAIEGALWVAVAGVQLREALDAAPETPYGAMPGLIVRIAHRL
ncbi:MAG: hypothetical protein ACE5KQ_03070 [Thermoplasmata archaeon]